MLSRAREVADTVFDLPRAYFVANRDDLHPPELQRLFNSTPSAPFSKLAPILYPPEFRSYAKRPPNQLFKSPEIAKVCPFKPSHDQPSSKFQLIKAALFGPESLRYDRTYPKPETMGRLWGISSTEDLPISTIAIFSTIVSFQVDYCLSFEWLIYCFLGSLSGLE